MTVEPTDALLIVDVQNTFCPGGNLPVTEGDAVVPPLNKAMPLFAGRVWATQDWHPSNHCSFQAQGGIWPVHAVQHTYDAALHPDLNRAGIDHLVQKGTLSDSDAYSGFEGTDLAAQLHDAGIKRVFVGGLATDYCVKASALDARKAGFEVVLLTDAARAVNVNPGDGDKAIEEMQENGCAATTTTELTR
jgi:nicotinamidase/pyrazinamidase